MATLTYLIATSLDGRIAAADGDTSAFPMGDHVARLMDRWPETFPAPFLDAMGIEPTTDTFDTVVMGRATYGVGARVGLTSPYPHLDQWVFSRSPVPPDPTVTVSAEDPVAVVDRLVADGRRVWLCGGGRLASALADRIDRLVLKQNPILLGGGLPLFHDAVPTGSWHRVEHEELGAGVVVSVLDRA